MRRVFADTLFWVASILTTDSWHIPAQRALVQLGNVHLVTTDEVLVETLSALAGRGPNTRREAIQTVRELQANSQSTVVPQSSLSFIKGLMLYESRPDKAYSLVDCISMTTMREMNLTDVLTNDHHFMQEGFTILIHR